MPARDLTPQHLHWEAFALAVPVGLLAAAILVVNNVRDIDTDRRAGKRTLAVRLGARGTRMLYVGCLAGAFALAIAIATERRLAVLALISGVLAIGPARIVLSGATGRRLVSVLAMTGRLVLVFGVLLAAGIGSRRQ